MNTRPCAHLPFGTAWVKPAVLVCLVSLGLINISGCDNSTLLKKAPDDIRAVLLSQPKTLQNWQLLNHNNETTELVDVRGHWTFIVFGYTHCPDVCPATLSQMVSVREELSGQTGTVPVPRFFFVSVDPNRDTTELLSRYIDYFHEDFMAFTGREKNIKTLEAQMGATHRYEKKNADGEYAVTHSAEAYLLDPKARVVAKFAPPVIPQTVAHQYRLIVAFFTRLNS